jgi:hypothetical protein
MGAEVWRRGAVFVADRIGVTRQTVRPAVAATCTVDWRARRAKIPATTLNPPPLRLGITHWSTRLLADELGISHDTVARVWREYRLQPWRSETFKFSTDPT